LWKKNHHLKKIRPKKRTLPWDHNHKRSWVQSSNPMVVRRWNTYRPNANELTWLWVPTACQVRSAVVLSKSAKSCIKLGFVCKLSCEKVWFFIMKTFKEIIIWGGGSLVLKLCRNNQNNLGSWSGGSNCTPWLDFATNCWIIN